MRLFLALSLSYYYYFFYDVLGTKYVAVSGFIISRRRRWTSSSSSLQELNLIGFDDTYISSSLSSLSSSSSLSLSSNNESRGEKIRQMRRRQTLSFGTTTTTLKSQCSSSQEYDEEEDEEEDEDDDYDHDEHIDWRSFRAHLVSIYDQNNNNNSNMSSTKNQNIDIIHPTTANDTPTTSAQGNDDESAAWIYDTGISIETGTVLLHKIDNGNTNNNPHDNSNNKNDNSNHYHHHHHHHNAGYGLARQYLHKSVVLILEHEDNENFISTKGIILNRPTDLVIHETTSLFEDDDDEYEGEGEDDGEDEGDIHDYEYGCDSIRDDAVTMEFPIWFGGYDWGIHTAEPKFFCLHSISSSIAKQYSKQVMNGIYFTSIQKAKDLVHTGMAEPQDFWCFSGFIEWNQGELVEEIKDGVWNAVNMDASIVTKGLQVLTDDEGAIDVEHAGVQTWTALTDLMHRKFQDLYHTRTSTMMMELQQTSNQQSFDDKMLEEWAKRYLVFTEAPIFLQEMNEFDQEDISIGRIKPGTILRSSSKGNPFLLSEQEFHKSLVLVIKNDDELSAGLILNHPTSKTFETSFRDESRVFSKIQSVNLPVRFGGCYGGSSIHDSPEEAEESRPLFVLHMNQKLRDANVGEPIGPNGVWSCTVDQCIIAIAKRIAHPEDFLVVDGFCLWSKVVDEKTGNVYGGIGSEVQKGSFDIVSTEHLSKVWTTLLQQQQLTTDQLESNFNMAESAWILSGRKSKKTKRIPEKEEVIQLNDEALKRWISTNLNEQQAKQ